MDVYQDVDGQFLMDCPAIWSAFPPILDGLAGPDWGEGIRQGHSREGIRQGVHLIWYVHDILILGDSQKYLSTNLEILLQTCNEAGLLVNKKNSQLTPGQHVNHFGQKINMNARIVGPPPAKLCRGLQMTKTYLRRTKSSPAHLFEMAGKLLDLQKGNVALHGLAK